MRWEPRRHLPIVAGVSLIVAAIGLVAPWWTLEAGGGPGGMQNAVSPFDAGRTGAMVDEGAVVAVGVLAFVGVVGLVGGLVLGFREDDRERSTAGWLWLAAGGFLLVAPLTAVITWPAGDASFWDSVSSGSATIATAAGWGWYTTLVAGATAAVAGMAWLLLHQEAASQASE